MTLTFESLDLGAAVAAVQAPDYGATAVFIGTVRSNNENLPTVEITYSAYETMALAALERIANEVESAHEARIALAHRLGRVRTGESSVVIAAAAPHRAAAFDASRTVLERLKKEVPIWKLERFSDGSELWREHETLTATSVKDQKTETRAKTS